MRIQTRGLYYDFSVALMSRAFADHNMGSAKPKETSRGGADQSRVRVYGSRQVFHQIWLEENAHASDVNPK
jgi:hypothetical protein